ncbi:alkaline phosphatase [Aquamicrobium defluvii]|uniref:Alkaline phosphatase n=1 Tax=Aquamicrobium defluvii TaxID=69279 RepID=A0A011UST0_9HYPH|nr:alkaline phosphatase [Aquamicrobium defluvii]EXL09316.1 alkaline phosphatase [Aquamicrobium defluvii]EZQ15480.1 alkaline phosphatase [Halopseudomonas bauzanensis]TDR36152.1 alkaline phosphatase [Aquamicrobium defluvii]
MRSLLAILTATTILVPAVAGAATVYPLDRATILTASPFDVKVEFDGIVAGSDVTVTINGKPAAEVLGKEATFIEKEDGVEASAVRLEGVTIAEPGTYTVIAKAGDDEKTVTWEVYGTAAEPKAKNVIFLIADGLSVAHRTAARIMSKGMTEGKANGRLNMDELDRMAFIGTSSTGSVATDSANTMSAYMTGHKSAVNALGVYADRTADPFDDPKVETLVEALRRQTSKSVGIVTTSELQDATPAALFAHTRRRAEKAAINTQIFDLKPEVILGGGSAYFLPQSVAGSKRKDDTDHIEGFKEAGYTLATTKGELEAAAGSNTGKVLGLFHTGNMDTTLDREFLKKGTVDKFPEQPGLVDMTKSAIGQLSKNAEGFVLIVEAANVDKMSHPLDWDRAVVDTIEFDKAIGVAREFAEKNPDTLIVVTGDHTHGVSIIGTVDDEKPGDEMREKVGTYAEAGFPNYVDSNGDGYPDSVDVSRRLFLAANNGPDHYETFRPKLDGPFVPAIQDENKKYIANEAYKDVPGAVFVEGNIPRDGDTGVHAVDDVVLQATGPGSENFRGYMEQSDVYRVLADALALGSKQTQ